MSEENLDDDINSVEVWFLPNTNTEAAVQSNHSEASQYSSEEFESDHSDASGSENDVTSSRRTPNAKPPKGKGGRLGMYSSQSGNYIQQRVRSAQRLRSAQLKNQISELKRRLEEVTNENRVLKRLQARQDKLLGQYEHSKGELPMLLKGHTEERRALEEKLRRSQEQAKKHEQHIKKNDKEMWKLRDENKMLNQLIKDEGLGERKELKEGLLKVEKELELLRNENKDLTKKLKIIEHHYEQKLVAEKKNNRQARRQFHKAEFTLRNVQAQLQAKEQELARYNVYSHRLSLPSSLSVTSGSRLQGTSRSTTRGSTNLNTYREEWEGSYGDSEGGEREDSSNSVDAVEGPREDSPQSSPEAAPKSLPAVYSSTTSPSTMMARAAVAPMPRSVSSSVFEKATNGSRASEPLMESREHTGRSSRRRVNKALDEEVKKNLLDELRAIDLEGDASRQSSAKQQNFPSFGEYKPSFFPPDDQENESASRSSHSAKKLEEDAVVPSSPEKKAQLLRELFPEQTTSGETAVATTTGKGKGASVGAMGAPVPTGLELVRGRRIKKQRSNSLNT